MTKTATQRCFLNVGMFSASIAIAEPGVAAVPAACPSQPTRIVRSAGGLIEYRDSFPGIPELCHVERADGKGDFYFGIWKTDWPGAGDAFPALVAVIHGATGHRQVNRSWRFDGKLARLTE